MAKKRKGMLALKKAKRYHSRSKKSLENKTKRMALNYTLLEEHGKLIEIERRSSLIGVSDVQKKTIFALGLSSKIGSKKVITMSPTYRGMLLKVVHLVNLRETAGA